LGESWRREEVTALYHKDEDVTWELGEKKIVIYFNCKWVFTGWQWHYNKTQHTNNTHQTK
jgi:hypothetical protein